MTLFTNRLLLRELLPTDLNGIHELLSLPETDKYNTLGIPESIVTTQSIVNEWLSEQNKSPRSTYVFAVHLLDSNQFIGLIALVLAQPKYQSGEVWFKTHLDYWNKGYTTEALMKILDFGFSELHLHRIEAGCAVENVASAKVLEKAGMTREGMKRKNLPIRGEWMDGYLYAILEKDFSH